MDGDERRRVEMFIRVRQFGVDNAADFPVGSIGATQFAAIDTAIDKSNNLPPTKPQVPATRGSFL